jgi:PPOX class probable F420-dependent enzyme
METIPDEYLDLFERETIAHLATLMPNGAPQVTPVWIDYDEAENRLLVNTAEGRQKVANVSRDPTVGLSMTDPDDPHRCLSVIGRVVEQRDAGAAEHMDSLERRYRGNDEFLGDRTERLVLVIQPEQVWSWGEPPHYELE